MKKIIGIIAVIFLFVFAGLLAIPYFFKDDIVRAIKKDLNKNLTAHVDFENVEMSLFKTFPDLYVELQNFSVTQTGENRDIPLAYIQKAGLTVDLIKLFGGEKKIKEIHLNNADFVVYVTEDGKANYDIFKDDENQNEEESGSEELELEIEKFTASKINLLYDDQSLDMQLKIKNLNHQGNIKIDGDQYVLTGKSQADTVNFVFDKIAYLDKVKAVVNHRMNLKNEFSTFEISEIDARINELPILLTGLVDMKENDDIVIKLNFASKENSLPLFMSLIPANYMSDLPKMDIQGQALLKGKVDGIYNEKNYPAFDIHFEVKNGKIKGKDLPESIHDLKVLTEIQFPGGDDLDMTRIDLPHIRFSVAGNPLDGKLHIRNPMTDPFVHTAFKGNLDLSKIKQAIPLATIKKLEGLLNADFEVKARVSDMEKQQTDKILARGYFNLKNFVFESDSLPYSVQIPKAQTQITPRNIKIENTKILAGKSDFSIQGKITNYLAFATGKDSVLQVRMRSQSQLIDFNELSSVMSGNEEKTNEDQITYAPEIPENVDVEMELQAGKLIYEDMSIDNLKGLLRINDKKAEIKTLIMKALGGELTLTGVYDSSEKNPYAQLKTSLKKAHIDQSAQSLTYLQTYAPVLKKVKGLMNLEFSLETSLDSLMNPVLSTTDATGFFNTASIRPENLEFFKTVAGLLKIKELENPVIDQVKARFSIEQGLLNIKPFDFKINNISSQLGGNISLDQKLDLMWNMEIPVEMFGNQAQAWLNNFQGELNKLGLPVNQIKTVYVTLKISGDISKPQIKPVFRKGKGMQGAVETVKETVTQLANEKIEETKAQAEEKAQELIRQAEQKGDELVKQAEKAAKKIREEAEKQAQKLIEQAKNPIEKFAAKKAADKIRKEADKKARALIDKAKSEKQRLIEQARQKADQISNENN